MKIFNGISHLAGTTENLEIFCVRALILVPQRSIHFCVFSVDNGPLDACDLQRVSFTTNNFWSINRNRIEDHKWEVTEPNLIKLDKISRGEHGLYI